MQTNNDQTRQAIQELVERIESPEAQRLVGKLADSLLSGRLSDEDLELLAPFAEPVDDSPVTSLTDDEKLLLSHFRRLNHQLREGAVQLLKAVAPYEPHAAAQGTNGGQR